MSVKNPVLLNVPNIIKTKRLIMRPTLPEDAEVMLDALNDTEKELQEFLTWADPIPTLENTRERNSQLLSRFILRESFSFNLFSKNGDFVGNCHICRLDWNVPSSIIG